MFFKKKSGSLQHQLEKALKLVQEATRLATPYLYEKDYQPTEEEMKLIHALHEACGTAYAYTGHIMRDMRQRVEVV